MRVAGGSQAEEETFYTALYHALLYPSVFTDVNGQYVGEDGRVHVANGYTQYTNFSEWDIYRGEMQLLALLAPRTASDMIRSLVADGQQLGRLPRWVVAGSDTGLMVGDPADAIIADAYAFGARGFDAGLALREMLNGAGVPAPAQAQRRRPAGVRMAGAVSARRRRPHATGQERPGLGFYLGRGYIPVAPSTTLEYAIADFAISQLAGALGDQADQRLLLARSDDWRKTFDPNTGFVEPRMGNGAFPRSWSLTSPVDFVEGNAWQYTLMVPQDMGALLAAIGSRGAARGRLDRFFAQLNAGPTAPYAWLGNEPSFLAPYAYLWLGAAARSEEVVRRAVTSLFSPVPGGLPGNDDLGATSAWFVWSALGLYPVIPGVPGLALVSPLFPHATVTMPNGSRLEIDAAGATADTYVRSLTLDGKRYDTTWLPLARITAGGRLAFTLGPAPSAWATSPAAAPPSFGGAAATTPAASRARHG
jgi:predicted alpha-1,2-mannosidase